MRIEGFLERRILSPTMGVGAGICRRLDGSDGLVALLTANGWKDGLVWSTPLVVIME